MAKVDYKKVYKHLYSPRQSVYEVLDVPAFNYLMIDGEGDPNSGEEYQQKLMSVYSLSYTVKFAMKGSGLDYVVTPIEGLWWMDDMSELDLEDKSRWKWTILVMQPPEVTPDIVEIARHATMQKRPNPSLPDVRLATLEEGTCAQVLYVGPYTDEAPTIRDLHRFAREQGYELAGKHHEIYLSDPRRTAPERLRTVIRQPITKA